MYHPPSTSIRFKCPECDISVTLEIIVPEVDYSYERLSDSLSEDDVEIECPNCSANFTAHVQNSPSHCAVELMDYPDVEVDADDAPFFGGYDEEFGVDVENEKDPLIDLKSRLKNIEDILSLTGNPSSMTLATQLAYGSVITAFETYLWETLTFAVEKKDTVVRNIITKIKFFSDQNLKLGEIFDKKDSLKILVKTYLQDTVWHRWETVAPLLKHGMGITPPSFSIFKDSIVKRHDIVHRSGHAKDGTPITINHDEVRDLIEKVLIFSNELDKKVLEFYVNEFRKSVDNIFAEFNRNK